MSRPDPATLGVVRDLLASVADEMAYSCMHTALSPNIRDRRDLSAAVFDARGTMLSHAAHIPVHLGAMPLSVRSICSALALGPGDVALMNDPFAGGTHLPDITVVAPVFASEDDRAPGFHVALRAHHADVGGPVPGSMAPQESVFGEGLRIPPVRWLVCGREQDDVRSVLLANMRAPSEREADLRAQAGALAVGAARLRSIAASFGGLRRFARQGEALVAYAATLARAALRALPDKRARVQLPLDAPSRDGKEARIAVALEKRGARLRVDFAGTGGPVLHGLNATRAVTISAVYHLMRCLCPHHAPPNEGLLRPVALHIPRGSMLDALPPHPVAGGNVETSQRVVDALWLAASRCWPDRVPAPGSGSMSNWTFGPLPGGPEFPTYYETVPGGGGGGPDGPGHDAIQQHMTNTRSTPVEVLEARWPVRVERLSIRPRSGGAGRHRGGNGLIRAVRFLAPAQVSCLMTRHHHPPPGVAGGAPGKTGRVDRIRGGRARRLAPCASHVFEAGDVLRIQTPGGGGWGRH